VLLYILLYGVDADAVSTDPDSQLRNPGRGYVHVVAEPIVQSTTDIAAPVEIIFDILADPAQHPKIDGSTTVRRLLGGPRRLSAGSQFSMSMRLFGVPYRVTNRVVEFELNRLIAWRHFEPQRWRYELEPVTGGTRVTESFDYSSYSTAGRWLLKLAGCPGRNRGDRSDPAAVEGGRRTRHRRLIRTGSGAAPRAVA
jgi:Polyketide cyclase / dehydrase and lipid transport